MIESEVNFEAFGVAIKISGETSLVQTAFEVAKRSLIGKIKEVEIDQPKLHFHFGSTQNGFYFDLNGSNVSGVGRIEGTLKLFDSYIRVMVAEATTDFVFLHCGVVGWKGKSILFPGSSFRGKSTIISALIEKGFEYYSDEYALIDLEGKIHPYRRPITIRVTNSNGDVIREEDHSVATGDEPKALDAGLIIFTEYVAGCKTFPQAITKGQAIMELIQHTIPIKSRPAEVLDVLGKTTETASYLKGSRGDVKSFINFLFNYIDNNNL